MSKILDLVGKKYGKLLVLKFSHIATNKTSSWECICECGNVIITSGTNLTRSRRPMISCGCYGTDGLRRHYSSGTRLYNVLRSMNMRCYSKKAINYEQYGGRGITICDEWKNKSDGFLNFKKWALSNGYKEDLDEKGINKLSIDRINVNGNYCPENCRWTDKKTQTNNRTNNMKDKFSFLLKNLVEYCMIKNIAKEKVFERIDEVWEVFHR